MRITALSIPMLALLALTACGERNGAPAADASAPKGSFAGGEPEPAAVQAAPGLPKPDLKKPLDGYPELQSGEQIMFLYVAASRLPPDFPKLAENYSQEYRQTSDSFRRNDLLQAIKPQLEQKISAAAASPYAWMLVDNSVLGAYDFERKGFPVREFDHDGNRYFYDNSDYQIAWANRDQVQFAPVADEAKARELEAMRTQYGNPPRAKVYFFAQSADLNRRIVRAFVTRVQIVDKSGRVIVEYGPGA
ncbi:MAG: DUF4852 domain-containing protein [Pseudoxanthomonas sp.]